MRSDGRGASMRPRVFRPGEIVFLEGMHGEEAFLLKEGAVEIFRSSGSGEVVLATITPGDIFGEMALVDSRPRSASAPASASSWRPLSRAGSSSRNSRGAR